MHPLKLFTTKVLGVSITCMQLNIFATHLLSHLPIVLVTLYFQETHLNLFQLPIYFVFVLHSPIKQNIQVFFIHIAMFRHLLFLFN